MNHKILITLSLLYFSKFSSAIEPLSTATIVYGKMIYQYYRAYEKGIEYQNESEIKRQKEILHNTIIGELYKSNEGKIKLAQIKQCHKDHDYALTFFKNEVGGVPTFVSPQCIKLENDIVDDELVKIKETE